MLVKLISGAHHRSGISLTLLNVDVSENRYFVSGSKQQPLVKSSSCVTGPWGILAKCVTQQASNHMFDWTCYCWLLSSNLWYPNWWRNKTDRLTWILKLKSDVFSSCSTRCVPPLLLGWTSSTTQFVSTSFSHQPSWFLLHTLRSLCPVTLHDP